MEKTDLKYQLFKDHQQYSKKYSHLLMLGYFISSLIGAALYLYMPSMEYQGMGLASLLFSIAGFLSDLPDFWYFFTSTNSQNSTNPPKDFFSNYLARVEGLIAKMKTVVYFSSSFFFLGLLLILIGAFFWKNQFCTGLGVGLALTSAIKWIVDLFIQWHHLEFVRRVKKVD